MIYVHVIQYTFYHKMLMLYFVEEKWIAIALEYKLRYL